MRRLLPLCLVLAACGDAGGPDGSSFDRIQTSLLDVHCVTCHTAGTPQAEQSGLILEAGESYNNLVGAVPTHSHAHDDGLLRVASGEPERSLLLHKLHWEPDYSLRDYGNPMPLGGQSLSIGQIEFVRRWIEGGALRDGDVIDPQLLEDTSLPDLTPFVPPLPPAEGFQLTTGRFGVAPQFEREIFVYRAVGNAQAVFVNRIETSMRANSHHFLLYSFADGTPPTARPQLDVVRDLRNSDGTLVLETLRSMPYHVFFGGSMTSYGDWRLPPGIALRLPANTSLDLNSHYVNTTDAEMPGEVYANLYTIEAAAVVHEAEALNLGNFDIVLPPGQRTTLAKTFLMSDTTHVVLLTAHMHKRGERFVIRIAGGSRDGETVYDTEDWDHPDIAAYDSPIVLLPGEGLTSEITWFNETTRTISFGFSSEDEMGIIFGYRY